MSVKNVLRNALIYLILALLALFGVVFATPSSWLVFDVAVLLALVCALSLIWPLRQLRLQVEPGDYAADDAHGPTLQLSGAGWYAKLAGPSGEVRRYLGRPRTFALAAPLARGVYPALRLPFVAKDPFGWTQKRAQLTARTPLIVGPRREKVVSRQVTAALVALLGQPNSRGDEPSFDLREFRDYAQGDPVNQIDWKATARRDQVVVRENEPAPQPQWEAILVASAGPHFEQMLGTFVTLTQQAPLWQEAKVLTDRGLAVLPTAAALAALEPSDRIDMAQLAADASRLGVIVFAQQGTDLDQLAAVLPRRAVVLVQFAAQITVNTAREQRIAVGGGLHE